MKKIALCILPALLAASSLRAEEPPPLPPNPFANLPSNPDSGFNPFEDDEGEQRAEQNMNERPAGIPVNRSSPQGGQAPVFSGDAAAKASKAEHAAMKQVVDAFDYPDAEILDVTKAISKLTGKNFIYNPQDIKGRISIVSETQITVQDAYNAFLTALNMKGFALVPSGKYLRIERVASAKEKQTPIYSEKTAPNNDEFITRVIPLRYIDATEFEQTFRLWMPRESRMQAYAQTNTLIITDTAVHINRMLELINLLDVAGYQESLVVLPIRNAAAKDVAKLIEQIINDGRAGGAATAFGAPPRPTVNYGGSSGSRRSGSRGGSSISKIIADDRTNSLIVKANAAGIMEIRALVRRLDTKITAGEGAGRIHVIRLQFADAEELAKTISAITSGAGASRTATRTFPGFGDQAASSAVFQGEIKVSADKATQSLVVTASPQDFSALRKVVENLDVPRDQVFVEAAIVEMKINRDNSFGTSFVNAPNGIALPSASGALTSLLAGNPIPNGFVLGFKQGNEKAGVTVGSTTYHVNSVNGLLELIQGNTDANVIATPQIIALDNKEATIEISEQIQVPTVTQSSTGTTTSFVPDKAQLLLKVTPQINKASNFVKLAIEQKLENFDPSNVPASLQGQTQGKNIRSTTTSVIVQNEDTVVLSGLIRDSVQEITKKVPILGDIPILGWLFKNVSSQMRKTNLLVFITPRIIKQYDSIRKVLNSRLDDRDEFVRENFGSKDPLGRQINKLRGSLPSLTDFSPLPQAKPLDSTSIPAPSGPDRDEGDGYSPESAVQLSPLDIPPPVIGDPNAPPPPENAPPPPVIPDQNFED